MNSDKLESYFKMWKEVEELAKICAEKAENESEILDAQLESLDAQLEKNEITELESIEKLKMYLETAQTNVDKQLKAVAGYVNILLELEKKEFGKIESLEVTKFNIFLSIAEIVDVQEDLQALLEYVLSEI